MGKLRGLLVAMLVWGAGLAHAAAGGPPPVEIFGKLPAIESPKLSPGGTMLAYLSSVDGRRCLVIHHLDSSRPSHGVCPGAFEVRWFAWKTDERLILEVYAPSRLAGSDSATENRLVAIDVSGAHSRNLSDARNQRAVDFGQDEVIDMLSEDPSHILVALYRSDADSPDVVKINVDNGSMRTVVEGQNHISRWHTDAQGRVRLGIAVADGMVRTYYRDDDDSDFRLVHQVPVSDALSFSPLALADMPGTLWVASSETTGHQAIYRYDVRSDRLLERYAARPDVDIDRLILDRGRPLGYGYTVDEPVVVYTDPPSQQDAGQIAAALPDFRTTIVDSTPDGRRLLIFAAGGNRPGAYYLLTRNRDKAVLSSLGAMRPDIDAAALAPVSPVSYRARDGLAIHGYVTLPPGMTLSPGPGAKPVPFVVMPHGGPTARDDLGFDYIAQMIASRGYGVLQPNFRGSTGYGAAFERAGFQQWGLAMENDLTDGVRWLVSQKLADPARICIVGWSYGGYAALMGAIETPNLYRCAASMAGVTDLRRRLDRASRSRLADLNLPRYDSDPVAMEANSPLLHADRIRIPILLAHGRRDFTVPVEDTEAMETALRDAGKQVEAIYFDDDDHYLYREEDRIAYLKALDRFLAANLGQGAVPKPVQGATN
jgi:dipeptidyl aminopeptidase/acylaminoacyl peptidase